MSFDELDKEMRIFETSNDQCVLPDIYMVARIDGRGFTRLTREIHPFEAPFDPVFRDIMTETVGHLMNCGFEVIYGYTQSDEISLLFQRNTNVFGRKIRKYNSILAGEASACFSVRLGMAVAFDCRISQLPTKTRVVEYFTWRQVDAHRNALNAHCYWLLRKEGDSTSKATSTLNGMSVSNKNELLFRRGINFNDLPNRQKRGTGLYWEYYEKQGFDPKKHVSVTTTRRRLTANHDLPMGDKYQAMIATFCSELIRQRKGESDGNE